MNYAIIHDYILYMAYWKYLYDYNFEFTVYGVCLMLIIFGRYSAVHTLHSAEHVKWLIY